VKLIKKNLQPLLLFIFLGLLIGTLSWDIIERLAATAGLPFSLSVGPVGFDLEVISFFIRFNPGTFLGTAGGVLLFRSL
jgi:hypothetical protein